LRATLSYRGLLRSIPVTSGSLVPLEGHRQVHPSRRNLFPTRLFSPSKVIGIPIVCHTQPLICTPLLSAGRRPLPSCLGGGDLDGDEYNLIPLNDLPRFKPTRQEPPAKYDKAPRKTLDRHSTMDDVANFVIEYINSDVSPALIP